MEPVIDSTWVELMTLDSTVIATCKPEWNKQYRPNSSFGFRVPFRKGEYLVRVTNPKYQTAIKRFKIQVRKLDVSYSIGDIKLRRLPKSKRLGEVTVAATKIKFYHKGDTLVFNADAFNLAEGSMLDARVEQLPGAELKHDGRIYMNGKLVESVLLNGKDFFRGDNTVLLDNLPAYTVKHVKFYDKRSERSEGLRMDLNDARFVMDVELKREYQIGWLANAEAGGGTHERWLGRLFALRFTPQSRLTFYANANNTHETRKPGRNGDWQPGSIGNGTSTTETGGFDYLITDKNNRWEVEGNVSATHTTTEALTRQSRERFQEGGSVFSRMRQTAERQSTSVSTDHRFRFNLGPEQDTHRTELYLKPRFSYSCLNNQGEALSAEFSANPTGNEGWESVFGSGPEAGGALMDLLIHRVRSRQRGNSENLSGGADATLYFELPWNGRRMELTAGVQGGRQRAHSYDLYTLNYAPGSAPHDDHRHRYYHTPSDNFSANAGLAWGYSLWRKGFHSIGLFPHINYGYTHGRRENSIYRLDRLEEMSDADFGTLPSTRAALLEALDAPNSYIATTRRHSVGAGVTFSYDYDARNNKGERTQLWRLNVQPGVMLSAEHLDYDGQPTLTPQRTAWTPTLNLTFVRNTPGMLHQFWVEGNYRQQLPSLFSLMGLRFDSDPLNLNEGNAGLRRTEVYSVLWWYMSDRWGRERQRRLSARVEATFYRNAVATAQLYDAATGVRTFRPQNVNGNYDVSLMGQFSTPLDKERRFTLTLNPNNHFYRSIDLQGTDAPMPVRSTVLTNYLSVPLSVEYSYNKVRVGVKGRAVWHVARSRRAGFQNVSGANLDAGLYGHVRLPWDVQLSTDLTYYTRQGYDNAVMNTDNVVWNAQLSKSVMKGSLTFALVGYDILGDLSNLTYSVNAQGVTETWRNVIPRYGMIRIIYKLNKPPKKRQ